MIAALTVALALAAGIAFGLKKGEAAIESSRGYCVICHDARGTGQGKAVLRGMLPPPNLHAARATGIADGELFHIITRGQGNMDSYAVALSEHERWLVIGWVRQLQQEGP